jgi:hypothetical protein
MAGLGALFAFRSLDYPGMTRFKFVICRSLGWLFLVVGSCLFLLDLLATI